MSTYLPDLGQVVAYVQDHPVGVVVTALTAVILLVLAFFAVRALIRLVRRWAAGRPTEDILTVVAATIATGVSASGMWKFASDVLHLDGPFRVALFAFIELAVVVSALRARRSMRENYSAGIDGVAVWVLAGLTAVLSTLDAHSLGEAVFRLAAPLVAAWLWERGMSLERQRLTGFKRIHWRLTPERVLVRLGLAEAQDRSASEVDAQRRLTRVALAADKVAELEPGTRRHRRAVARLKKHGRHMVEHTTVSQDETQQTFLLAQIGVARSISRLAHAAPAPFWETPVAAIEPPFMNELVNLEASFPEPLIDPWEAIPMFTEPVTSEAAGVNDEVNTAVTIACTSEGISNPAVEVTETVTSEGPDDEQASDRDRPDEQDNRAAEKWIRASIRKGRTPTYDEVKDKYGFSRGWARLRVLAARDEMTAKGYRFLPGNVVVPPSEPVTVNGSRSDHADDVAMTPVGVE